MKFLCDQMLGTLAKWLRILGFDTYYPEADMKDSHILDIAKKQKRVLITRDKELIWDARRNNIENIKINSIDLDEQLKTVLEFVEIDSDNILSRCTVCNSEIKKIDKKNVENKVPEHVFETHKNFWFCPICDKIYWKGSHFIKMLKKVDSLKK
jgi:uncharacterized protein